MGAASEDQGDAVMSLALLQNKIKRDPEAYREEFFLQLSNFQGLLGALKQQPQRPTRRLQSLAMFLAHTVPCYSAQAADSWASGGPQEAPQAPVFEAFASDVGGPPVGNLEEGAPTPASQVKEIIQQLLSISDLHPSTRHALLNATLLLRSKKMLSCEELLQQSLSLLCLKDKFVRQRLMGFVVKDVSRVFAGTTNNQVYRHLSTKRQTSNNSVATKLVNAVAAATLAGDGRLANSAALFLLGELQAAATQASHAIQADEEEDEEAVAAAAAAELQQTCAHACKKTLAAKRKLKKQKQRMQKRLVRKQQRAEQQREYLGTAASAAILDLLYDPHSLAEKLFARVRQQRESFSTRVVFLNLLSRLVSHHKLLLLNIYPFMQRYLKPSQRLISPLLAICANLVHAAVPPQEVMPLVKDIADNFANDTQGEEVLTVGLNAITEICTRNPLAMTAELLSHLLQYTKHKNSKSVSAAARGLLNLYRDVSPLEFGAFHTSENLSLLPQLEALKKRLREEPERDLEGGAELSEGDGETEGEETEEEGDFHGEGGTESETEESGEEAEDDEGKETEGESEGETEEEASGEEGVTDEETEEEGTAEENEEQKTSSEKDEEEVHTRKKRRVQASEPSAADPAAAHSAPAGGETSAAAAAEETAAGDTGEGAGARLLTDADFAALRLLRAKQLVQQVRGGPRRGGGPQIDAERDLKLLRLLKTSKEGTADGGTDSEASVNSSGDSSDEDEQRNAQEAGFVSERDLEGLAGRKRRQARERNRMREEKLLKKKRGTNKKWPQEQEEKKSSKPQHVKDRSKPLLMIQQPATARKETAERQRKGS
ncbi:hypothetical protein ACSSS7_000172 [Eimeria intestinalis]